MRYNVNAFEQIKQYHNNNQSYKYNTFPSYDAKKYILLPIKF